MSTFTHLTTAQALHGAVDALRREVAKRLGAKERRQMTGIANALEMLADAGPGEHQLRVDIATTIVMAPVDIVVASPSEDLHREMDRHAMLSDGDRSTTLCGLAVGAFDLGRPFIAINQGAGTTCPTCGSRVAEILFGNQRRAST